jgi:hypothetical protein
MKEENTTMNTNESSRALRELLDKAIELDWEVEIGPEIRPKSYYDLTDEGGLPLTGNPPYRHSFPSSLPYKKPKKRVPRRIRSGK